MTKTGAITKLGDCAGEASDREVAVFTKAGSKLSGINPAGSGMEPVRLQESHVKPVDLRSESIGSLAQLDPVSSRRDESYSRDETTFVSRWSEHLAPEKWGDFLVAWSRALSLTGTPMSFLDELQMTELNFKAAGAEYTGTLARFPTRFVDMKTLIERYPLLSEISKEKIQELGFNPDACGLCQRGLEAFEGELKHGTIPLSILAASENFLLVPNRFPWEPGGSLLFARQHDDMNVRVHPQNGTVYPIEPGRTRGALVSTGMLESAIYFSDLYDLVVIRNHVLDGMSVPFHEHYQAFPSDLPKGSLMRLISQEVPKPVDCVDISSSLHTPFDSCILASSNLRLLVDAAVELCQRLELDNQVFTLAYYNGAIKLSVRHAHDVYTAYGSRVPLHYFHSDEMHKSQDMLSDTLISAFPLRGEFPWEDYLRMPS